MGFIPPLNLGGFQPSPATLAQWVYQIWQYLQENPIATQEQLQEYIGTFITSSPETQAMIGEGVEQYLTENPPQAPVQSVQGKTGAVVLSYPDIVPASNAVPVYRAASVPSVNTLIGQYNLGYRLFVNTATQEIFTITPAGDLSKVGRGNFDGTTVDVNSAAGDTTIAEALNEHTETITTHTSQIANLNAAVLPSEVGNVTLLSGTPVAEYFTGVARQGKIVSLQISTDNSTIGSSWTDIASFSDTFAPGQYISTTGIAGYNPVQVRITSAGVVQARCQSSSYTNVNFRISIMWIQA